MPTAITFWEQVAESRWGRYVSALERADLVSAAALAGPPDLALEVGADGGRWSRLLRDLGWQMTCTDIDPETLARCQARIPDATCLRVAPEDTRLPLPDHSVSLLLCVEVPPVIHSDWFLREARRVLRPGGIAFVMGYNTHSLRGLFCLLSRLRPGRPASRHPFYQRSYVAWRREIERAGFTLLRATGLCWAPFPRKSNSALIGPVVALEGFLGLRRLPRYSPWVLLTLRAPGV
jgi:SAM-dependent methyltransferase